jgi:hypothetical protein
LWNASAKTAPVSKFVSPVEEVNHVETEIERLKSEAFRVIDGRKVHLNIARQIGAVGCTAG